MKKIFNILCICSLVMLAFTSCQNNYIDSITKVDPGPDAGAPLVTIVKPVAGFEIQVPDPITSVNIEFDAVDDIELAMVTVSLDGTEIASYKNGENDTFTDYRIVTRAFTYNNVTTGDHMLTVTATDLAGNVTTSAVNFSKKPPYTPLFAGEMFYMGFDGSFTDLISITDATEVGGPIFAGGAKVGTDAYKGKTDAYLTYPTAGLLGSQFSAAMWYKMTPTTNADNNRAGILVIGPPDPNNTTFQNNRKNGFRFFREQAGTKQRFKLNVGNGTADSWFDGGAAADVDPMINDWVHLAFTISGTECVVYINGQVVKQGAFSGVDWTGCDIMSIMSGDPRFTEWNHHSDLSSMDELRLFNTALTQSEVVNLMAQGDKTFNMSFDGSFAESISKTDATEVGSPGFAGESHDGLNAYGGVTDSYLTFPTAGLLGSQFSATMWYKMKTTTNADNNRAGILVIGPPDPAHTDFQNNRKNGFRFFREQAGTKQRFKLNVGNGTADSWFDGGAAADVDPTINDWVHLAFTISGTECVVYINGQVVKQGSFSGVDWTGCDILSIMSGDPRFTEWNHHSDLSAMDELQLFDKALSQTEIQAIMAQ